MKSAVIDIGSARTKLTVAEKTVDGKYVFTGSAYDTAISSLVNDGKITEAQDVVRNILHELSTKLSNENIDRAFFSGTHVFREQPALHIAAQEVAKEFSVLTPDQEANYFYSAIEIEESLQPNEFWALDVGGGSIQLVWSDQKGDYLSAPCGTYSLEKKFQADLTHALDKGGSEWRAMAEDVKSALKSVPFSQSNNKMLVVGSNVMADFFVSALQQSRPYCLEDINLLVEKISGKVYKDLYSLFPANSGFMHGADKLLAVICTVIELGRFEKIIPTNASLSKGICQLLLEKPDVLKASA